MCKFQLYKKVLVITLQHTHILITDLLLNFRRGLYHKKLRAKQVQLSVLNYPQKKVG